VKTAFRDREHRDRAVSFGMALFITSLAVIFVSTMLAVAVVRQQLAERSLWPDDLPPLPSVMWLSTIVLLLSSVPMHVAMLAAGGDVSRARGALLATLALGTVFLCIQTAGWLTWFATARDRWVDSDEWRLALTGFYVLTGLHGIHVLGGMIAVGAAVVRIGALPSVRARPTGTSWRSRGSASTRC